MAKHYKTSVKLTGDNKELIITLDDSRREMGRFAGSAEKQGNRITSSLKRVAGVAAIVTAAVMGLRKSVDIQRETDRLSAGVITATGSIGEAKVVMRELNDIAKETPFVLDQSVEGFTKLVNLGLTPSKAAIISYGNTASAMGKDLNQMIEAVADATTGEFERLKEFGIKARQNGDRVALTFRGMTTEIGNNAAEIERYLMALGENEFAGAMARRMDTLDGSLATLEQNWDNTFRSISEMGVGDTAKDAVDLLNQGLEELNASLESGQLVGHIEAIGLSVDGLAGDVQSAFDSINGLLTNAGADWEGYGQSVTGTVDFVVQAFKQLPQNIRAAIQIGVVEWAAFIDEYLAQAEFLKASVKALFNDDTIDAASQRLGERQKLIRGVRAQSLEDIMAEREASLDAVAAQISQADALREAYDQQAAARKAANKDVLAQYKVQRVAGAKTLAQIKAESKAHEKQQKDISKWYARYRDVVNPARAAQEEFNMTIAKLNTLLNSTNPALMINQADYDAGVKKAKELYDARLKLLSDNKPRRAAEQELSVYQKSVGGMMDGLNDVFVDTWSNLDGGFDGVTESMQRSFKTMLGEMANDALTKPILLRMKGSMMGDIGGGSGKAVDGVTKGAGAAANPYVAVAAVAAIGVGAIMSKYNKDQAERMRQFTAEYRQANQFRGTVLGDIKAQSHSVAELTQSLGETASDALSVNVDMYRSLLRIESNLKKTATGVAGQLSRRGGLEDYEATYTRSETVDKLVEGHFATLGVSLIKRLGMGGLMAGALKEVGGFVEDVVGGLVNSISGAIYSQETSLQDAGLQIYGQSLADVRRSGRLGLRGYQQIETATKTLGFVKRESSTRYRGVDDQVKRQLGLALIESAKIFDEFNDELGLGLKDTIGSFKVGSGNLSLKGLRGDALTNALESYLSNTLDNWSTQFLKAGGLQRLTDEYQQAGEGQFQTLGRLVTESRQWQSVTQQLGLQFNATKVRALELTQQLAQTVGGFNKLNQLTSVYRDKFFTAGEKQDILKQQLQKVFGSLNQAVPTTRQQFRQLVEGLDLTTAHGQKLYAQYIQLAPAVDQYISGLKDNVTAFDAFGGNLSKNANMWSEYFGNLAKWGKAEQARVRGEYTERLQLARRTEQTIKQLKGWLDGVRLGDLSTATPQVKLAQTQAAYEALLQRAKAGDVEAQNKLGASAESYLKQADAFYGRSAAYAQIFEAVTAQVEGIKNSLSGGDTVKSLTAEMNARLAAVKNTVQQQVDAARNQAATAVETLDVLRALPQEIGNQIGELLNVVVTRDPTLAPTVHGSHSAGLSRVPFDGYRAELHRDEMVLTSDISNKIRAAFSGGNGESMARSIDVLAGAIDALKQEQTRANAVAEKQRKESNDIQSKTERNMRSGIKVGA